MARAPAALRLVADRAARALAAAGVPAPGERVGVAVSGGADSLALLHALRTLAGPRGWALEVLTVDHGLYPGSAADAGFVCRHAAALGLPARLCRLDRAELDAHRAAGPEGAARAARYAALERLAGEGGCGWIATGHTLDDQAETVVLQLLRGAGTNGLAGMAVVSGNLLRPLLGVRRAETRACCAVLGLAWRSDPANADQRLLRNAVRQRVLPLLEELRPGAAAALARTAALARDERAWMDALAAEALAALTALTTPTPPAPGQVRPAAAPTASAPAPGEEAPAPGEGRPDAIGQRRPAAGEVRLAAPGLAALPVALGRRVVRAAARAAGQPAPDADATERVLALAAAPAPAGVAAWTGGGLAAREGGCLVLPPPRPGRRAVDAPATTGTPGG